MAWSRTPFESHSEKSSEAVAFFGERTPPPTNCRQAHAATCATAACDDAKHTRVSVRSLEAPAVTRKHPADYSACRSAPISVPNYVIYGYTRAAESAQAHSTGSGDIMATGSNAGFRRSSYCGTGSCVEVGFRPDGTVAVRDGKHRSSPCLVITRKTWMRFQQAVRAGEFER
jgi:hypothetical protein